jgi:hypothetical protein
MLTQVLKITIYPKVKIINWIIIPSTLSQEVEGLCGGLVID